ncbi:MAG: hypothetical protein WC755_00480 [Candidatus Woesearchaeota archaeon]|jgi:hypothetical protein
MALLGRPVKSKIRQNMIEILFYLKRATGYDIYRHYIKIFGKVTNRSMYYHLKKGTALNEFAVFEIKQEKGDYSWGQTTEKIYYELGEKAEPKLPKEVSDYFSKN